MKKTLIVIIHVLSVLLFTVAFSRLYMTKVGDSGIAWVKSEAYVESPQFADAVNTDIGNLKRLALYTSAFGDLSEVEAGESENTAVLASGPDGMVSYTAGELLKIASSFGCKVDFNTGKTEITELAGTPENYDIRVVEKAYDPGFLDNLEPGPSQGVMSLKELSMEVAKAVSDYIALTATYCRQNSNLAFILYYPGSDGYFSLNNTDIRADSLMKQPKFVHTEGISKTIETNIVPAPENAVYVPREEETTEDGEYFYELFVGIDTAFPYADRYQTAEYAFNANIRTAYTWIAAGVISLIIAVISLVVILTRSEDPAVTHLSDRLPIEAYTLLLAVVAVIAYFCYKLTLGRAFESITPIGDQQYVRTVAKTLITYGMIILILRSGIRKYKDGTIYSTSLFSRLELAIEDYLLNAGHAGGALLKFLFFAVINAGLVVFACLFYVRRELNPRNILISGVFITALIVADAFLYHYIFKVSIQRDRIDSALKEIAAGETQVTLTEEEFSGTELETAKSINNISVGLTSAVRDQVKSERLKADLITNVSHDIKTPLTSIITYVDLLKRENIQNEKAREYIGVLEKKSQRLKNLTEDLVEASKASSGNIHMEMTKLDIVELSIQAAGEFEDRFAKRGLEFCFEAPEEPILVNADGRHLWRVFENLFNNASKYALENTRVYGEVRKKTDEQSGKPVCVFTIKNVSQARLNISPQELTERFVRGDVSRTTEGSGLGLSIAQSLTKLMGGELRIEIDGDLYKANVILPEYEETEGEGQNI